MRRGKALFDAEKSDAIYFTNNQEANTLINDIEEYPHAFVLGCIADRQVKSETAFDIPWLINNRINGFEFSKLIKLSEIEMRVFLRDSKHRFKKDIAKAYFKGIKYIDEEYGGDASKIWGGSPSSAEVVYKFLQIDGIGPKIATMAANILARDFKIPLSDYYSIDISADRHVRRVFERLGFVKQNASNEEIIYKARAIYPEFPGILDNPCFEIGRNWCRSNKIQCTDCYLEKYCPFNKNSKIKK